ncbi:beta-1,3-glucanase family protein [Psychromicrobium sp. YIM B11713]|uniref:beta-1,3-glucanase family protein n=1 Tax=Psychromicrobium sp. YIM B11713 TaxID=3145233 RepID=UPI00374ED672
MEPFSRRALLLTAPALLVPTALALSSAQTAAATAAKLTFRISNGSDLNQTLYLYVMGTDLGTGRLGYVDPAGNFQPWPAGSIPPSPAPDASMLGPGIGGTTSVLVPRGFSGRLYLAFGSKLDFRLTPDGLVQPDAANPPDPNYNILFDFTEFTYNDQGLWLNSSQVDMFAIPHAVTVTAQNGSVKRSGQLVAQGRNNVVQQIQALPDWQRSVIKRSDGTVLRVLSAGKATGVGLLDSGYLDSEINRAWNTYVNTPLTVRPFTDQPNIVFTGRTSGNVMNFTDSSGNFAASFNKPSSANVWNCDGNLFAPNDQVVGPIARTLGAALNRSTLADNSQQPALNAGTYYQNARTNHYARIIHANMANGNAYAFPFDDVGGFESLVYDPDPLSAGIEIGPFN